MSTHAGVASRPLLAHLYFERCCTRGHEASPQRTGRCSREHKPAVLQRRCYWKLAGTPNIVLMHYRSPGSGKRTDRGSPPTAATPLTIHGRVPGYLPPPDAMQHAHSDLAGPAALPVPARAPGDTALAKSPQQMLGLEHDAAREHVGSDGASAVPPAAGAVPHVALNTPPADNLAGLSGAGDSLARWPSTDWYGGQGGGMVCQALLPANYMQVLTCNPRQIQSEL